MLNHIFLSISDTDRAIHFYTQALAPLGIVNRLDYDCRDGPPGHPDLKGLGADGRMFFWLRQGIADGRTVNIGFVGFVADSRAAIDAAYAAAVAAGAVDNGAPVVRWHYDPRYYAANVLDPDGCSLEFVYKPWQHGHDAGSEGGAP